MNKMATEHYKRAGNLSHTVKLQRAILFASTIALSTLSLPSNADSLVFDSDGNLMNASGTVVRVTVDTSGNVIDTTGTVVRITNGATGFIIDPTTGVIRGTIDTTGNLYDTNGNVIAGTSDSRLVAVDRTTGVITGTIDSNGHVITYATDKPARVILVPRNQTSTSAEGILLDPVSGAVRGRVDNSGRTRDLDGHPTSSQNFRGLLVIDPVTKVVKGSIDQDGHLITLDLTVVNNNVIIAKSPSSYIMDPITGQIKGFIDTSGNWFDVSGTTMSAASGTVYTIVDPQTRVFKGYVDRSGLVVSSDPQIPDSYRRTTSITSSGNGQTSQTVTTTTTTSSTSNTYVFPQSGTFMAVNPLTGEIRGIIDPATRTINGVAIPNDFLIVDKNTGVVDAIVNSSGELVIADSTPVSDMFANAIDKQQAELDRMIANVQSSGKLTGEQVQQLRAQLDKINALKQAARESGNALTYSEAFPIIQDLKYLNNQLVTIAHLQSVTPIIRSNFIIINGQAKIVDNIAFRRLELTRRIGDEFTSGHLNSEQMSKLKNEIDRVSALETSYRSRGDGSFTDQESRTLFVDYDRVASDLEHYTSTYKHGTVGNR